MQITVHSDIHAFLKITEPALREHEAANNLLLGVALRVQKDPNAYGKGLFCATLVENERLLAAALMTPPYNLILYCAGDDCDAAWRLLADELRDRQIEVPGVIGQAAHSRAFARAWKQSTREDFLLKQGMRTFELRRVLWPRKPGGFMRLATLDDLELVSEWKRAFEDEALGPDTPRSDLQRTRKQIENEEMYLWVECEPVSMAAITRPVGDGVSISWVYTPPAKRRVGYASALVAALSQRMLDRWYKYCTLFTDLSNPTSNDIYQRIGYKAVCDYEEYKFVKEKVHQTAK